MLDKKKISIAELRKRKQLLQNDCAQHFGISLTTFNNWENNFGKLPVYKALELVNYLSDGKMTLDDIYFL